MHVLICIAALYLVHVLDFTKLKDAIDHVTIFFVKDIRFWRIPSNATHFVAQCFIKIIYKHGILGGL